MVLTASKLDCLSYYMATYISDWASLIFLIGQVL